MARGSRRRASNLIDLLLSCQIMGTRFPTVPGGRGRSQGGPDALAAMAGRGGRAIHGACPAAGGLAAGLARSAGRAARAGTGRAAGDSAPSGTTGNAARQARRPARAVRLVARVGQLRRGGGGQPVLRRGAAGADRGPGAGALLAAAPALMPAGPAPLAGAGPAHGQGLATRLSALAPPATRALLPAARRG